MGIDDKYWMQLAYEQALIAKSRKEVPIGAVLVAKDNHLLAKGANEVIAETDPSAHAEIVVIRRAAGLLNNYRLDGTTLFVTLEPCAMCAGAIMHARINRLVFATRDFKAGAAGSVINLFHSHLANKKMVIDEGLLQKQCAHLLQDFFAEKR